MSEPPSRADLTALVQRLIEVDYASEDEGDRLYDLLRQHVADPEVLYGSSYRDLTAEEVVDRALAYRPIVASYSPD